MVDITDWSVEHFICKEQERRNWYEKDDYLLSRVLYCRTPSCSCRSSKTVVEEEKKDSLVQTSNVQVDIQTTTETKTNEDDSTEVFTVTIITEYDTAKADSTGKSPVLRQTQITEPSARVVRKHKKRRRRKYLCHQGRVC